MRLKRVLLTGFGGAVVLCGATLLWLFNTDLGRFQPQIQAYLGEQLHREVKLDTLSLELGWPTRLALTGLSIANAPWAGDKPLLEIDRLDGAVDLWSLLKRDLIIVDSLDASGIRLQLAWDKEGASNFQFGADDTGKEPARSARPRVILREITVADTTLDLVQPDHANHIGVSRLSLDEKADGMIAADLKGTVNDQPLSFTGQLGTFDALLAAANVRFDGTGQFARLDFKGSATVDDLKAPNRPVLDLQVSGPDISDIERFLGVEPAVAGAFKVHVTSSVADKAKWQFEVDGQAGEVTVEATGQANGLRDLSTVTVSAQGSGPSLQNVAALFGFKDAPAEAFKIDGAVTRDGAALAINAVQLTIGPTRLKLDGKMDHFPHVLGGDIKLDVSGPDLAHFRSLLKLPGIAKGPFELNAELKPADSEQELLSLQLKSQLANVKLDGTLTRDPAYLGSKLQVDIDGPSAAAVLERFSVPGVTATPFTAKAAVTIGDGMVSLDNGLVTGLYDGNLGVDGDIGYAFFDGKTQLNLSLAGPDLDRSLSHLWPGSPARKVPYEIKTLLQPGPGQILLKDMALQAGQTNASATVMIPLKPGVEGLDITFSGKGPDLSAFLKGRLDTEPGHVQVPDKPWAVSGRVLKQAGKYSLTSLNLQVADLAADGQASLPWPLHTGEMTFKLNASGNNLATLFPEIHGFSPASAAYTVDLDGAWTMEGWQFESSRLGFAGAEMSFEGDIDGLPDFSSTDFSLDITIPSLQALGAWKGEPLPDESVSLNGRLSGSVDQLSFQQLQAALGKSKSQGQLNIKPGDERLALNFQMSSESLDLRKVWPVDEQEKAEAKPKPAGDGLLIPDTPINFGVLKRFDGDADINIGRLTLPDRILDELLVNASLDQGSLVLHRYHSKGLAGDLSATGSLDVLDSGGARIALKLRSHGPGSRPEGLEER